MPYDEGLAQRIREILDTGHAYTEKKMFGGVGFMLNGNMAVGVNQDNLIVRVGVEKDEEALSQPHARPFDFTGKPMLGWIYVSPDGYASDADLVAWIQSGVDFALSLPPK